MIKKIIYWVYTVAAIVYAVFYMLAIDSIIESTKTFIIYTAILIVVLLIGMLIHHRFSSFDEWLEDKIQE
jgi:hypothetical protein